MAAATFIMGGIKIPPPTPFTMHPMIIKLNDQSKERGDSDCESANMMIANSPNPAVK